MATRTRPGAAPRPKRTGGVIHKNQVATLNGVKVIADGNGNWRRFNPLANSTTSGQVVGTYSNAGRSDSRTQAKSTTNTSLRSGGRRNRASSGRRGAATTRTTNAGSRNRFNTKTGPKKGDTRIVNDQRQTYNGSRWVATSTTGGAKKGQTKIQNNTRYVYNGSRWVAQGRPRTQTQAGNEARRNGTYSSGASRAQAPTRSSSSSAASSSASNSAATKPAEKLKAKPSGKSVLDREIAGAQQFIAAHKSKGPGMQRAVKKMKERLARLRAKKGEGRSDLVKANRNVA